MPSATEWWQRLKERLQQAAADAHEEAAATERRARERYEEQIGARPRGPYARPRRGGGSSAEG